VLPLLLSNRYGSVHALVLVSLLGALGVAVSTLHWMLLRLRGGGRLGASGTGMVLAHLGVVVFVVGVAMVKGYGIEHDVSMSPGQVRTLGNCQLSFDGMAPGQGPNYDAQTGLFTLVCGNGKPRTLVSEKRTYVASGMPMTESAIQWNLLRDIYVALSTPLDDAGNAWSVRVQYKPFMRWVWLGVLMMGAGVLTSSFARRLRRASPAAVEASA
jgi:cytochrome c-type biogenesis protein CcmF